MKNTIQNTSTKQTAKKDVYQMVTDRMIDLLEKGTAPWRCPWKRYGLARNYATNHIYSGINAIWMNLTPHPIPYFLTFNQVKAKGGKVRKGAKSEMVFFFKSMFKDANNKNISPIDYQTLQASGEEAHRIGFLKYYRVFNIADIEEMEIDIPQVPLQEHEPISKCEQLVTSFKDAPTLIYENANQAYYKPSIDTLNMPNIGQFETAEEYYCTLFHELIHSTGHQTRLNREGIIKHDPFGSAQYSKEELLAEMGASFLCAHAGINNQPITENSAAYLQGWLSALKGDKKLIFQAAAQAQKASDYILGIERSYS